MLHAGFLCNVSFGSTVRYIVTLVRAEIARWRSRNRKKFLVSFVGKSFEGRLYLSNV